VAELASTQRGRVTRRQLTELGLSDEQIARWVAARRIIRVHGGVYAVGHLAEPPRAAFQAAVLAGGENAAVSHRSAACHLGLLSWAPKDVDVMVPRGGEREREGIRFHRPKVYAPEDRFVFDGIPCTTVARTLVDLGAVLRLPQLERAVEQAELLEVLDIKAVAGVLARIARPRGVRNLRRCLGAERLGAALTQSGLERRFLRLCLDTGLPRPVLQHPIELSPGRWHKVDFAWPDRGLAVEIDGGAVHTTLTAARRDRHLDRGLRNAGWRVERFMEDDVIDTPELVLAALRTLLSQSRDE
jgi:hypothetical protein